MYTGYPGCGYGYSYPYYGGYSYPYYGYYPYGNGRPSLRSRVPSCTSMRARGTARSRPEVPCVRHGVRKRRLFAFSDAIAGPGLHTLLYFRAGSSARPQPLSGALTWPPRACGAAGGYYSYPGYGYSYNYPSTVVSFY